MIRFDINSTNDDGRISFEGDTDTFFNHPADNELGFTANGTETVRIEAGKVGINNNSPNMALDVTGSIRAFNGSNAFVQLTSTGSIELKRSDGAFIDFATAGTEDKDVRIRQVDNGLKIETGGEGSVTEKFRIGSSGQIGLSGANYGTSGQIIVSQGGSAAPQWANPSDSGIKGEKGQQGQKGEKGEKGQKGVKGDGETGAKGDKGQKGEKGQDGSTGLIDAPYGAVAAYSNSNQSTISYNESELALELQSSSDGSIGAAFPAFRVNSASNESHKLSIKYKASAASGSGFYVRVYEYDAALPDGKLAVSHSATNSLVQEDSRKKGSWKENAAITTDWQTTEFDYTPTSTAVWTSIVVLNWSGMGSNSLFIRDPLYQLVGSSGSTGAKGQKGEKGAPGATGAKGSTGDTGSKGSTGDTGSKGSTGDTGSKGSTGDTGQKGATGTGQKGATGSTGQKGATGSSGSKGQKGQKGQEGDDYEFPSGTRMIFQQTSAPTGWTKDTSAVNQRALRVVSGSAGSGGNVDFTTAFSSSRSTSGGSVGNRTLTKNQLAAMLGRFGIDAFITTNGDFSNPTGNASNFINNTSSGGPAGSTNVATFDVGNSATHNHGFTNPTVNLAVRYLDVIIAVKD